jgi:hypothetical protein
MATVVVLTMGGALLQPGEATAVGRPAELGSLLAGTRLVAAASLLDEAFDEEAAIQEFVLWMAQNDEREIVRSAAWNAVLNPDGAAAIDRFLNEEFAFAVEMAESDSARNKDFVAYVLATHIAQFSPEVHAAAVSAARGTDAQREDFVLTGYAAAKARDRQVRDAQGQQAAALVAADRAFVARRRDDDPGPQVRAAADWALRSGVDGDLVEFFTHGWANAARLDLQSHRTVLADNNVQWRNTIQGLVVAAEAAEKAAAGTAGEARAQARALAARAWATVGVRTGPARAAWADAEQVAVHQADTWKLIAVEAAAADSPNWRPIAATADQLYDQWDDDQDTIALQAAYWKKLYDRARAAELLMQSPTG